MGVSVVGEVDDGIAVLGHSLELVLLPQIGHADLVRRRTGPRGVGRGRGARRARAGVGPTPPSGAGGDRPPGASAWPWATGRDLPLASASSDMIGWGRVLLSHTHRTQHVPTEFWWCWGAGITEWPLMRGRSLLRTSFPATR